MQTTPAVESLGDGAFRSRVYARIGLLGNPSDGYNGRVLALSLSNFWADVVITPSPTNKITFELNPDGDPTQFTDLASFESHIDGHGYNGGVRLLVSMTRQFSKYCLEIAIPLDPTLKFSLSYSTNIPRQRGLSGSSAIACAALNCLLAFYNISEGNFPVHHRPELILAAEEALGITAGLQDRIIQVYGGLVSMNFTDYDSKEKGSVSFPLCRSLDPGLLPISPPLFLIYNAAEAPGKDSGSVHSNFKEKWRLGDKNLQNQMQEIADLVPEGITALENQDYEKLSLLINCNFQSRKLMFGEAALGKESLKMIEIANSVGVAAKFTGSGGAVVALPLDNKQKENLEEACHAAGLVCAPVLVGPPIHHFI
jgi:glucuronokinase